MEFYVYGQAIIHIIMCFYIQDTSKKTAGTFIFIFSYMFELAWTVCSISGCTRTFRFRKSSWCLLVDGLIGRVVGIRIGATVVDDKILLSSNSMLRDGVTAIDGIEYGTVVVGWICAIILLVFCIVVDNEEELGLELRCVDIIAVDDEGCVVGCGCVCCLKDWICGTAWRDNCRKIWIPI